MDESKSVLMERLRREGRWAEASKFKDDTVRTLRAEGTKRAEAGQRAWQKMADEFPPVSTAEPAREPETIGGQDVDTANDDVVLRLSDAAERDVELWQEKYGVTLSDDARAALIGEEVMYFWAMGRMGQLPGFLHKSGDVIAREQLPIVTIAT